MDDAALTHAVSPTLDYVGLVLSVIDQRRVLTVLGFVILAVSVIVRRVSAPFGIALFAAGLVVVLAEIPVKLMRRRGRRKRASRQPFDGD